MKRVGIPGATLCIYGGFRDYVAHLCVYMAVPSFNMAHLRIYLAILGVNMAHLRNYMAILARFRRIQECNGESEFAKILPSGISDYRKNCSLK